MSRLNVAMLLTLVVTLFASCSETDDGDTEYQNWESRNNEYFESIYQQAKTAIDDGDTSWLIIKSWSKVNGLKV